MRRCAPGVAAVVCAGLLGLTGCGSDAGAATTKHVEVAPSGRAAAAMAPSSLAGLVVVPADYVPGAEADSRQVTGPFSAESFLSRLSASPAEDRALFLNAAFTEGYQAFRTSADGRKRFTVQLFKAGSIAKAKDLQQGFWNQEVHSRKFAVPGVPDALTDARVVVTGATAQVEAVAEVSFVVGTLVAEISISQTGKVSSTPTPDTALIATIAKQQKDRLARKSG